MLIVANDDLRANGSDRLVHRTSEQQRPKGFVADLPEQRVCLLQKAMQFHEAEIPCGRGDRKTVSAQARQHTPVFSRRQFEKPEQCGADVVPG